MQKIVTSLWFDTQAEEAIAFYCSLFDGSRILGVGRYGPEGPGPEGTVMAIDFELAGQTFNAINGGPEYTFTEATSLRVNCDSQEEVDRLWEELTANGGEPGPCGWLKDRFGLSWQIVPTVLAELMADPDPAKSHATTAAMLKMGKLDIAQLQAAHDAA